MDRGNGADVLSNRQRRILVKRIKADKASEPKPEPATREVYEKPEIKHADDTIIPGLSGRGTIKRLDTLDKLLKANKINGPQYCAGMDYLQIVEGYFATASGLAKLSDEAGRVGGDGDPIRLYAKGRPAREINGRRTGYIPTQRPRNPASSRAHNDGWTGTKLNSMAEFSRMAKLVGQLTRDQRQALCVLVIDPNRPDIPALTMAQATRRMFGDVNARRYAMLTRWLCEALDAIDAELVSHKKAA